jgi:hypothetical protein
LESFTVDEIQVEIAQEKEVLFHDLDVLLRLALVRKFHSKTNKRAVKEMVKELWDRTQPIVQQGVLKGMMYMKTDELDRTLNWFISDYLYYSVPATQLGAQGFDGYAIHEKVVYPVEIWYETPEDYHWARMNQSEIWTGVCRDLLYTFRDAPREEGAPRRATADVLLFQNRGYNGLIKHWGVEMNDDLPFYLNGLVAEDRNATVHRIGPKTINGGQQ